MPIPGQSPGPWKFTPGDDYRVEDADGTLMMSDASYYPAAPDPDDARIMAQASTAMELLGRASLMLARMPSAMKSDDGYIRLQKDIYQCLLDAGDLS